MKKAMAVLLMIAVLLGSTGAFADEYGELSKGSRGAEVRALQERLKELGYYGIGVDGDYGNGTVRAVASFQFRHGLKPSGVADGETLELLYSSRAKAAPEEPPVMTSKVSIVQSESRISDTVHNGTREAIDNVTIRYITFFDDGSVMTADELTDEDGLMTNSWVLRDSIGAGQARPSHTKCDYIGLADMVASGVEGYHTASGMNVYYPPEAITFCRSDGAILYPSADVEPLVYRDGASGNEKYGTSYDDEVFAFIWGVSSGEDITPWLAEYEELPVGKYVVEVQKDSALDRAGIRAGDVLVSVDGEPWGKTKANLAAKDRYLHGEAVEIEYYRDGEYATVAVSKAEEAAEAAPEVPPAEEPSGTPVLINPLDTAPEDAPEVPPVDSAEVPSVISPETPPADAPEAPPESPEEAPAGNTPEAPLENAGKASSTTAEELIKLADLLDKGLITREEFDALKAGLLGG